MCVCRACTGDRDRCVKAHLPARRGGKDRGHECNLATALGVVSAPNGDGDPALSAIVSRNHFDDRRHEDLIHSGAAGGRSGLRFAPHVDLTVTPSNLWGVLELPFEVERWSARRQSNRRTKSHKSHKEVHRSFHQVWVERSWCHSPQPQRTAVADLFCLSKGGRSGPTGHLLSLSRWSRERGPRPDHAPSRVGADR